VGYEIYIWPKDQQATSVDSFVNAFNAAGVPASIQTDQSGHWLIFTGHESALSLEVRDKLVKSGGIKLGASEDPSLLGKVVDVLGKLGWAAGDDEGELE
jgi:hypothetical protein